MTTQILLPTPQHLTWVAQALANHQVIGLPTETVYGLAGHARSDEALEKIFQIKKRPYFDPLIVHISAQLSTVQHLIKDQLIDPDRLSNCIQNQLQRLMDHCWPGPLTIILPKHPSISDWVTSGLDTVALRMPQHPIAQALLQQLPFPLAAPSANRFGRISPTSSNAVLEELGGQIPWILEGGPCFWGVESTILGWHQDQPIVLRPGSVPQETLEQLLKTPVIVERSGSSLKAPGQLAQHYCPQKPLYRLPCPVSQLTEDHQALFKTTWSSLDPHTPLGLLLMQGSTTKLQHFFSQWTQHPILIENLSPSGQVQEAAHHLFSSLRQLDQSSASLLYVEPCLYTQGLGPAIADRIQRASVSL